MSEHQVRYAPLFQKNLRRYRSFKGRIRKRVAKILDDPYHNTEPLGRKPGGLNLRGCRSARVGRNFRIIFVICEECRRMEECEYCFCEGLPDQAVVFLTVGPHERAYEMREAGEEYVAMGST